MYLLSFAPYPRQRRWRRGGAETYVCRILRFPAHFSRLSGRTLAIFHMGIKLQFYKPLTTRNNIEFQAYIEFHPAGNICLKQEIKCFVVLK